MQTGSSKVTADGSCCVGYRSTQLEVCMVYIDWETQLPMACCIVEWQPRRENTLPASGQSQRKQVGPQEPSCGGCWGQKQVASFPLNLPGEP